jgi:hypothetical protein
MIKFKYENIKKECEAGHASNLSFTINHKKAIKTSRHYPFKALRTCASAKVSYPSPVADFIHVRAPKGDEGREGEG